MASAGSLSHERSVLARAGGRGRTVVTLRTAGTEPGDVLVKNQCGGVGQAGLCPGHKAWISPAVGPARGRQGQVKGSGLGPRPQGPRPQGARAGGRRSHVLGGVLQPTPPPPPGTPAGLPRHGRSQGHQRGERTPRGRRAHSKSPSQLPASPSANTAGGRRGAKVSKRLPPG